MPKCDVCGKKVSFLDLNRIADGKCCNKCRGFASLSRDTTIADIKMGMLQIENSKIIIDRMELFFISEYKKIGLDFTRKGSGLKNAVALDVLKYKYITFYNGDLYFVQGWNDYYSEYYDAKYTSDINIAKTVEFKPLKIKKVPYNNIEYYYKDGDIQYTTEITGGGGGGTSITGALLGGLVAGSTGAIIGSRKSVAPIETKTRTYNTTKTILVYRDSENRIVEEYESHEVYNYLLTQIPERDLKFIQLSSFDNSKENHTNLSTTDEIRKFKELLDEGIITQEEFESKKKRLLGI